MQISVLFSEISNFAGTYFNGSANKATAEAGVPSYFVAGFPVMAAICDKVSVKLVYRSGTARMISEPS